MRRLALLLALTAFACAGSQRTSTEPPATELAPPAPDCVATCGRAAECGLAPAAGCDSECRGASSDDGKQAYWACLGSSVSCDEMLECARTSEWSRATPQ
jgi:hypothetical protein